MITTVTLATVYIDNFIKENYWNKYKSILYLCNFLHVKEKLCKYDMLLVLFCDKTANK